MSSPFPQSTNQYLYTLRPVRTAIMSAGPTAEEAVIVAEHWAYLQELFKSGLVIFAGRTLVSDETSFASIVFQAETPEAAQAIMEGDPVVNRGIMRGQLFPYQVLLDQ
jgi:uncharacterized protein YciI